MSKPSRTPFTKSWRADLRHVDKFWMADFRGPNITPALSDFDVVVFETEILETIAEAQENEAHYCLIWHGRGRRRRAKAPGAHSSTASFDAAACGSGSSYHTAVGTMRPCW